MLILIQTIQLVMYQQDSDSNEDEEHNNNTHVHYIEGIRDQISASLWDSR